MYKLTEDLSKITTIQEKYLEKLNKNSIYCINDAVSDTLLDGRTLTTIDIGIGKLLINVEDNQIQYKFKPDQLLEMSLKQTVLNKQNLLEMLFESTLVDKIENTYKNYL